MCINKERHERDLLTLGQGIACCQRNFDCEDWVRLPNSFFFFLICPVQEMIYFDDKTIAQKPEAVMRELNHQYYQYGKDGKTQDMLQV